MIINIKGTNIELTEDIKQYVNSKLPSVSKFINIEGDAVKADVELARTTYHHNKGDVFKAELNLAHDGRVSRVVSEKDDLHAAIDDMKDQILHELRSLTGKRQNLLRKGQQKLKGFIKGFFNK